MNFKVLALILLAVKEAYQLLLRIIDYKSSKNPIPASVADVYDGETYAKWKLYQKDKTFVSIFSSVAGFLVTFALILFDVFAAVGSLSDNEYLSAILVLALDVLAGSVVGAVFSYIDTMRVEEKYGFNKSTIGTFIGDVVKELIIGLLLNSGIVALFITVWNWLGDWVIVAFAGLMFLVLLFVAFLYPVFAKINNKFVPLEEGELRTKLEALLEKHGYHVREIKVMDASRRTTKSNAYFTGFGKMKTIVLYDTLLQAMTTDEICAVFAHELGHGLHKDTLKNQIFSIFNMLLLAVSLWLVVRTGAIYPDFGFSGVNYGMAIILGTEVLMSLISPLVGLLTNASSRRAEYRADRQAAEEGYAEELISALKKLARENFANLSPSKTVVALTYSHPTIAQRIDALRK
ncbi:MAG: M48 family metallopeptidase [Clostridia bacterium]|nr:M48 family metallopeptidase [Clostridia bacterium]